VDAATVPSRHPLRLAGLVAAGVVLVAALAAAVLYLWLRTYAPLSAAPGFAPGPGLAADIEPATGSGGRPVLIPTYRAGRTFDTAFTLENTGRFTVEVRGLAADGAGPLHAQAVLASDSSTASADPEHLHPFATLRLSRGDTATVVVRWQLDCRTHPRETFADAVPLEYRYLSLFTRTERVALPFAVTLRCPG
jgi:hypothetical protein